MTLEEFEKVVENHLPQMIRFARTRVSIADAEEAVQIALVDLYRKEKYLTFRGRSQTGRPVRVSTWLNGAVKKAANSLYRGRARRAEAPLYEDSLTGRQLLVSVPNKRNKEEKGDRQSWSAPVDPRAVLHEAVWGWQERAERQLETTNRNETQLMSFDDQIPREDEDRDAFESEEDATGADNREVPPAIEENQKRCRRQLEMLEEERQEDVALAVRSALSALPDDIREVAMQVHVDGDDWDKAASDLHVDSRALQYRVRRYFKELHPRLKDHAVERRAAAAGATRPTNRRTDRDIVNGIRWRVRGIRPDAARASA